MSEITGHQKDDAPGYLRRISQFEFKPEERAIGTLLLEVNFGQLFD